MVVAKIEKPVTPGDVIGVEEEYFPDRGAYVDNEGYIRSQIVGYALIDKLNKIVNVKHVRGKPVVPKQGDIVIGIVESVSNDLAFIDLTYIEYGNILKPIDFTGVLHISQASREYVENMYEVLRVGDMVKARILNNYNPFQLTTREPGLGVIVAFCTKCGAILKKSDDRLICPVCGSTEKRKISLAYMFR